MKRKQDKINQDNGKIWIDTIIPVVSLILGIVAIVLVFGLDRLVYAIIATEDDFKNFVESDIMPDVLIGFIIPFDIKVLICMLICILFHNECKKNCSKKEELSKIGMVISIVCMIISCTPLGNITWMLPGIVQGYKNDVFGKGDVRKAEENDYSISDLNVEYEKYMGCATVYGTIVNNTEYNWEYVDVEVKLLDADEEFENYVLTCRVESVLAGESVTFSNDTPLYVREGCYEDCKILWVTYDIDSRTR